MAPSTVRLREVAAWLHSPRWPGWGPRPSWAGHWWPRASVSGFLHLCRGDAESLQLVGDRDRLRQAAGPGPAWLSATDVALWSLWSPMMAVAVTSGHLPRAQSKSGWGSSLLGLPPPDPSVPGPWRMFLRPRGLSQRLPLADSNRKQAGRKWPSR